MNIFNRKRIFLDYAAGVDNPSAIHEEGVKAKARLDSSRESLARLFGVQKKEIVFTSGGTESDNLAILGVFEAAKEKFAKPHIIISNVEHPAVSEAAKEVERRGGEVSVVDIEDGVVSASTLLKLIKENTVLISLVYGNGHTGGINPVPKITRLVRDQRNKLGSKYPYVHTDATQAVGHLPIDFPRLGADLITVDCSKVFGPKGASVLLIRGNVSIKPIIFGGSQENNLRSGTENLLAIEALVKTMLRVERERDVNVKKLNILKEFFLSEIKSLIPTAVVNTPKESLPNIISLSFGNKLHEFLVIKLDERGVAASTGSACNSKKSSGEVDAIRFSLNTKNTKSELKKTIRILNDVVL